MVGAPKIELLREALGPDRVHVEFADIDVVGANPARIIPAWSRFAEDRGAGGGRLRGIGEPLSPARCAPELTEAQHHERLLNLAFAGADLWLLCPYDTAELAADVSEEARRSHPVVSGCDARAVGSLYEPGSIAQSVLEGALPEPALTAERFVFGAGQIRELRTLVAARAAAAGLSVWRAADLVLAANELATNSVRHGRGYGEARLLGRARRARLRDQGRRPDPRSDARTPASRGRAIGRARPLARAPALRPRAGPIVGGRYDRSSPPAGRRRLSPARLVAGLLFVLGRSSARRRCWAAPGFELPGRAPAEGVSGLRGVREPTRETSREQCPCQEITNGFDWTTEMLFTGFALQSGAPFTWNLT